MIRNSLWCLSICAVFFVSASLDAADALPSKPNVVLIFIDDMGYGDISPFGSTKHVTPHLEQLAAEGRKFHCFYATPVCSMSRACLMTGCYNARVSMPGVLFPQSKVGLHPKELTLAEVVKQQGYATKCIGKWHLGHRSPFLPMQQGFDSYFGIPYSNDMSIDVDHAQFADDCVFREGMTRESAVKEAIKHKVPLMRGENIIEYPVDQTTLTKRYTEEAVGFLREHKDQPFFLYLPHTMVHVPLAASESFRGKHPGDLLAAAIAELDWSIGEIMKTLRELQLDEKTLVIFTSDNGAATGSSAPWRGKKATNFEGGVREPCMMRWTGHIPPKSECHQIAGNIDVLPTIAKLVGTELPSDLVLDGKDIRTLMLDAHPEPVRDVHLYYSANQSLAAIRQNEWKLFVGPAQNAQRNARANQTPKSAEGELYNLSNDPYEQKDVAEQHPEIVKRLREKAEQMNAELKKNARPVGEVD